jgi:hypothetical protein
MSFGDLYEARPLFPNPEDVSTAIVRIYTPGGFVVAAEGRKYEYEKKIVVSDISQKIFPIEEGETRLAYTIGGTVQLTTPNDEVVYDITAAIHSAIDQLVPSEIKSLWHYGEALSKAIQELPPEAVSVVIGTEVPTMISFDGYYKGKPKRATVRMFYDGQEPEVSVDRLRVGYPLGSGSMAVIVALLTGGRPELLASYRSSFAEFQYENVTLSQAIEVAKSMVAAQCDPEALKLDPMCIAMGGHIHLCTVTPDAFRWIIEPAKTA